MIAIFMQVRCADQFSIKDNIYGEKGL